MIELTRRQILRILLAGGISLFGGCTSNHKPEENNQEAEKVQQNLVNLLDSKGIKPKEISWNNGGKTLLTIAEHHATSRGEYLEFLRSLNKEIRIAMLFREGVYQRHISSDPAAFYIDRMKFIGEAAEEYEDEEPLIVKLRRDYSGLEDEITICGIEDDKVSFDAYIMSNNIAFMLLSIYDPGKGFTKRKDVEDRVNSIFSRLRTVKLDPVNLPDKFPSEEYRALSQRLRDLTDYLLVDGRNYVFAAAIDRYLNKGETGVLVVGEGHVFNDRLHRQSKINLPEILRESRINSVVITDEQVIDFNRN